MSFSCTQKTAEQPALAEPTATVALAAEDAGTPEGIHYPSRRCGECHTRHFEEWTTSGHARAAEGAFAFAAEKVPSSELARCEGCHVPLLAAGRRIAKDGVGCDACHTARSLGAPPSALVLEPGLATRWGPFKDSQDHHFHRVGYSAFVDGAELCLACHEDRSGAAIASVTSGEEWRKSGYAGVSCQSCHMASLEAEAAKGSKRIRSVTRHDFSHDRGDALASALLVAAEEKRGRLVVTVENRGAGHSLPTDFPDRLLELEVEFLAGDQVIGRDRREYGKRFVDANGAAAPFFLAATQVADTRLSADEKRVESFEATKGARRARVSLKLHSFPRSLASVYGEPVVTVLTQRQLEMGVR